MDRELYYMSVYVHGQSSNVAGNNTRWRHKGSAFKTQPHNNKQTLRNLRHKDRAEVALVHVRLRGVEYPFWPNSFHALSA